MISLLLGWLIMAVSFLIVANIPPLGVEIESFKKAMWAAAIFGILNAILGPILRFLAFPITFLTLGLFTFVINAVIFALAASLVDGFRLRQGIWSPLLGSIALGIINAILGGLVGL